MCYIQDGADLVETSETWVAARYDEKVVVNQWSQFLFQPAGVLNLSILMRAMSEGAAVLELWSAPIVNDTGPEYTVVNRNQAPFQPVPPMLNAKVYGAPDITPGNEGTLLYRISQGNRNGGEVRDTTIWGLDKDIDYLVRLTNTSGAKRDMTLHVDFYEGLL